MSDEVEFGIMLTPFGPHASSSVIKELATTTEGRGFDVTWTGDHVAFPEEIPDEYPFTPSEKALPAQGIDRDACDTFSVLSYLAGRVEDIRLGTNVCVVPHPHPVVLTKLVILSDEYIRMAVESDHRSLDEGRERVYDIFPELEEVKNAQAHNLCVGQRQMLAIARALIGPTEVLMLDEPFEEPAPKIIETIQKTIMELKQDNPLLLVKQNFPMARVVSDRYYVLDHGKVVSEGPMHQLEENEELKERYLGVT